MMLIVLMSYNIIYRNIISNGIFCLIFIFLGMIVYMILVVVFKIFKIEEIRDRFRRRM